MIWLLAQLEELDREEALAKGWWNLSFILLVGTVAVLFLIAMIMLRRWKHKQLKLIEQDRAERRAGKSAGRVDAWAASAERYVDHDKLPEDDGLYERDEDEPVDDEGPMPEAAPHEQEQDDSDPFGLFKDKPYQDPEDEDDLEDEEGEDWEEEDDGEKR